MFPSETTTTTTTTDALLAIAVRRALFCTLLLFSTLTPYYSRYIICYCVTTVPARRHRNPFDRKYMHENKYFSLFLITYLDKIVSHYRTKGVGRKKRKSLLAAKYNNIHYNCAMMVMFL